MTDSVSVLARRSKTTAVRRWAVRRLGVRDAARFVLWSVLALTTLVGIGLWVWPDSVPIVAFVIPLLVAGHFIPYRWVPFVDAYVIAWYAFALSLRGYTLERSAFQLATMLLIMAGMWYVARSRSRLGTTSLRGDAMLVDLRDQIARAADLPALPYGWLAESVIASANGEGFSGDFVVCSLSSDARRLEVAVVDVSGKGADAGTRSLLLSNAFAGIAGSVPVDGFLPAANSYLVRQRWNEGFATAVHFAVDLVSGDYSVGLAGHPPPAQYAAGRGEWRLLSKRRGPLLGVMEDVPFPRVSGQLGHGDAILLYTDGVIEDRHHDLDDGVDRMLGVAARAFVEAPGETAARVCRAARSGKSDDRAAFVLRRR